ncbi:uncharacterized protein PGTG_01796 [Puccinia graminis f. sp. tritici CRL 75-36-700-3]|uniref:Uncharacterized protein n=1 Tax=Puccinia graminis f. sp. tritici (strain CRL 75-36-700-3 / race SCCL) TaxID=418459 RepID=E3JTC9_PUCGT|nr:uncharacterized protein PGTG_01796 [Puccinia graminis f. sp. tritici CRL 75-36-700-3]EFP75203.1 hypothetical protein PGTG_01796 [Puccinia graminis f. sp. tritici CRL 75-36-700-3]
MNSFAILAACILLSLKVNANVHNTYTAQPQEHPSYSLAAAGYSPSYPSHAVLPTSNPTSFQGDNSQLLNAPDGYLKPVISRHAGSQPALAPGVYTKPDGTAHSVHPVPSLPEAVPGVIESKHNPVLYSSGEPKIARESLGLPDYTSSSHPFRGVQGGPGSQEYGTPVQSTRNVIAGRDLQTRTYCIIPARCRAPVHCAHPASCRALARYCWKKASRCGYY